MIYSDVGRTEDSVSDSINVGTIRTEIARTEKTTGLNLSTDLYGVQTYLMQHKGYQNDLSATLYFQLADYNLIPFFRHVLTHYYYLDERVQGQQEYTSDRRMATGGGLDYKFNNYLRLRFNTESIDNKLNNTKYAQESYGLIYNQHLDFSQFELNNYLESFLIPRVSSNKFDTFLRIQAFKSFYFSKQLTFSNAIYPLLQVKAKFNDDSNFGISGQNASLGVGYKFYAKNSADDSFAFVLEAYSLFYQSKNFNGDWAQILAALQIGIN